MTDEAEIFSSFQCIDPGNWPVRGIGKDNEPLQVHGRGDVHIQTRVSGQWYNGTIHDVLYVPKLGANLFSIGAATKKGAQVVFSGDQVKIFRGNKVIAFGTRAGKNLYQLDNRSQPPKEASRALIAKPLSIWHQRLGNINEAYLMKMASGQLVDGLDILKGDDIGSSVPCEGCAYGKIHRNLFPTNGRIQKD